MTGLAHNTWRHSGVQLDRLLGNKNILKNADEIIFESPIQGTLGNSVTDVKISIGDRIIEIETKAGNMFFENIAGSNFVTQSSNSLSSVSKLVDYKVFLSKSNLEKLSDETYYKSAKLKVIDAWEKGGVLKQTKSLNNIINYGKKQGYDFDFGNSTDFFKENDTWFKEIFMNNITN